MKVSELIEALKKFDQDLPVETTGYGDINTFEIEEDDLHLMTWTHQSDGKTPLPEPRKMLLING